METLENPNPNPNPNLESPNKRQKTETLAPITPSINKGKSPIIAESEGEDDCETPPENCGICMSIEGESVRGRIDSCDHYFCFLCIIQWSKIESRCPVCRGRFSTIRRAAKDGGFVGRGCVRVPVRDQLYDPFGDPVDPYAQSKCSVCNGTNDESLLLLCDLCDSASHTYCVGLGATVPEDDWYCQDCALLRAEQVDSEIGDDGDHGGTSTTSEQGGENPSLSVSSSVSIFDIVRGPSEERKPSLGTDRLLKLVSHPTKFLSSAIMSESPDQSNASVRSIPGARSMEVTESSARTLQNCRNVQRHINVLRENWDAVRKGSLSFSAFLDSFGKGSQKNTNIGTGATESGKSQSFSSTNSLRSKAVDSSYDTSRNKEPYNVDRAWKLMTIAKAKQHTVISKSATKIAQNKTHNIHRDKYVSDWVVPGRKDLISPGLRKLTYQVQERPGHSRGLRQCTRVLLGSQRQESCIPKLSMPRVKQTNVKANLHRNGELLASSRKLQGRSSTALGDSSALSASSCGPVAEVCNNFRDKTGVPSYKNLGRGISKIPDEKNGFSCSTSSCEPVSRGLDAALDNLQGKKTSTCPGKVVAKVTSKGSKEDETKAEILSLVKLNLKLLTKEKQLGVDTFKEIARLSTHTVLAACGFEHRKIVQSLPTLVCHHGDETLHLHRSAIVPSSCRECFYVFVKDVVNSIMFEKLNCDGVAS